MSLSNTATRILVAIVGIPIILWSIIWGFPLFYALMALVTSISLFEFYSMTRKKGIEPNYQAGILFGILFFWLIPPLHLTGFAYTIFTSIVLLVPIVLAWELWRNKPRAIENVAVTVFGAMYIGLSMGSFVQLRSYHAGTQDGIALIFSLLISIWVCDSAAFFVGKAIGKHKLFPRVSPKKSWEGAIAGFIASAGIFFVLSQKFLPAIPSIHAVILGIIIGIVGQIGDLAESLLKRDAEIKDSSNIIPGHGGVLDRFDSILFAAPSVYIYLQILGL